MNIDTKSLTIAEARKHLDARDFSAVELAKACLKEIKERDGGIHAYLEVFDDVLEQGRGADERITRGEAGPLTGIPVALKDNILIKGKIASAASKILENYRATYDAHVTEKLKAAGAVLLGRTNMDEFAMGSSTENSAFGPTKNPHDTTRVPGGSSGGSAAAVAAGMCLGALGSDTAGSIRQPAALCGVAGLKPTYGSVSRRGLVALGSSLDVIGPIGKSVEDVEILFNAIRGKDALDSTMIDEGNVVNYESGSMKYGKKIGVPRKFLESSGLREDVYENFKNALEKLKSLAYEIIDIELLNVSYGVPAYYVLLPAEASANLARFDGVKYGLQVEGANLVEDYFKSRGEGFGPEPRRRIMIGTYVLSAGYYDAYYGKAQAVRRRISNDFDEAFKHVDIIATPTSAGPAFKIGEKADPIQMYLEDVFTVPANHTGLPALSVPSGTIRESDVDLPLGLQLMAPHLCEERLFAAGKSLS